MTDKKYTHFEKLLLHAYCHGIDEELENKNDFNKTSTLKLIDRAYTLGRLTGNYGDDQRKFDCLTNEEILNDIFKIHI
jgi:hypothetical protein